MSFAATDSDIVFDTSISGGTVAAIIADLHAAFTAASWPSTGITGGFEYTLTSPQGLECKVRLWDDSSGKAAIQFRSTDGVRIGFTHHIDPDTGRVYQCWANICQCFISIAGDSNPFLYETAMGGGVPYVQPVDLAASTCAFERGAIVAVEAWWSQGNDNPGGGNPGISFRYSVDPSNFSACYNGDLQTTQSVAAQRTNALRLLPVGIQLPWPYGFNAALYPRMLWYRGAFFWFDPLLAWGTGTTSAGVARMRAQLWDALLRSETAPLEDIQSLPATGPGVLVDFDFINYMEDQSTDATRFCSLYLLKGVTSGQGDFAYMY